MSIFVAAVMTAALNIHSPAPSIPMPQPMPTEKACKLGIPAKKCGLIDRIKDYGSARDKKQEIIDAVQHIENQPEKLRPRSKCEGMKPKIRHGAGHVQSEEINRILEEASTHSELVNMPKCGGFNKPSDRSKIEALVKKLKAS